MDGEREQRGAGEGLSIPLDERPGAPAREHGRRSRPLRAPHGAEQTWYVHALCDRDYAAALAVHSPNMTVKVFEADATPRVTPNLPPDFRRPRASAPPSVLVRRRSPYFRRGSRQCAGGFWRIIVQRLTPRDLAAFGLIDGRSRR